MTPDGCRAHIGCDKSQSRARPGDTNNKRQQTQTTEYISQNVDKSVPCGVSSSRGVLLGEREHPNVNEHFNFTPSHPHPRHVVVTYINSSVFCESACAFLPNRSRSRVQRRHKMFPTTDAARRCLNSACDVYINTRAVSALAKYLFIY